MNLKLKKMHCVTLCFTTYFNQSVKKVRKKSLRDTCRTGKILRVTSLDELPQLLNVLKGEMSLVGPRPLILAEEKIHSQRLKRGVYSLRPGVTGYAQVNGRDLVDEESKVNLDTEYLMHISFFLDLKILLKTAGCGFWHINFFK